MAPLRPSLIPLAATVMALGVTAQIVRAAQIDQEFEEYQVKAVFLCKLAGYITWPPNHLSVDDKEFRIAIIGRDPFGESLEKATKGVKDQKIHGRPVVITRYKSISDYRSSHLTFVGPDAKNPDEDKPEELLAKVLKNHPGTLVVGDTKGLAEKGAMINFQLRDQRVAFEINATAMRRAGFQVPPSVMRLASIVNGE